MIVSGGESLIDFIERPSAGPIPSYEAFPGGSPYNVALALGRLGAPSGFLGRFSGDRLGRLLAGHLEATGARPLLASPSPRPTPLAVVSLGEGGQATYQFYRQGTADGDATVESLEAALPQDLALYHTGSLALAARADAALWKTLALRLAARGVPLSIDPNIRPRFVDDWAWLAASLGELFERAALVKTSDEDLHHLGIDPDPEALRSLFVGRHGVGLFAVTRGAQGALLLTAERAVEVPALPPPVFVDTVGAGDTFMGGLLARLAERGRLARAALKETGEDELLDLGRFAAAAAGLNCGAQGCDPPRRDAVLAAM